MPAVLLDGSSVCARRGKVSQRTGRIARHDFKRRQLACRSCGNEALMAITAVLLAGGESLRMGRDKATLVWHGRPLWEWQIEKLRKLCPGKIVVSAKSDLPWRPADVDPVLDVTPSRGPLSGLAAALACTETEYLLALAVDMP